VTGGDGTSRSTDGGDVQVDTATVTTAPSTTAGTGGSGIGLVVLLVGGLGFAAVGGAAVLYYLRGGLP
jgi:hypothetical protein